MPKYTWPQQFEWTKHAWTGDNAPYHKARLEIEHAVASDSHYGDVRTRYYNEARKNPSDPLALFRWAYATYEGMLHDNTSKSWNSEFGEALAGFYAVVPPLTYDYDRVRYLVMEAVTPNMETIPIAKRLLKRDPDDLQVAYDLASAYLYTCNPARVEEALSICKHLKSLYPHRASLFALTGFAYVALYHRDRSSDTAKLVVENYEEYLKLAAPTDPFRKRAEQIMAQYKRKMKR